MSQKICFVGGGNMAASLIGGLIADQYSPEDICASDIDQQQLASLSDRFGIETSTDNIELASSSDVIVLAIKPQVMREVCENLSMLGTSSKQLFISIAAGVPATAIDKWLGANRPIVRCMPNTPALLQLGASGLFANARVDAEQKELALQIMQAVGIGLWVDSEDQLDAVTAISGSGPAYFFYFIELLVAAGTKLGLPADTAAKLARQTALGAANMAIDGDVVELRAQVTSKKGTTEQAILSFQRNHLDQLVNQATEAARHRSQELAEELTKP
ncbi:MAG: pyrroline-5-carboxylate reductase [Planctomycetota bacterium]|jgi:pyrroline-5-carboxylate reductase